MFRDRRFLRCLRADAEVHVIRLTGRHRWPSVAFWHHVFDIPRFRVWYNCNRAGSVDGWLRIEPFLGFFHQSSKSLVVAAEARGHIFATFCLGRRCRLVVFG